MHDIAMAALSVFLMQSLALLAPASTDRVDLPGEAQNENCCS